MLQPELNPYFISVVVGLGVSDSDPARARNAEACLRSLHHQDIDRRSYRIIIVEQGAAVGLSPEIRSIADQYIFCYNSGEYSRGWGFNVGVKWNERPGGYLCLIDGDLLVERSFLSRCLFAIQNDIKVLLPASKVRYLYPSSTVLAIAHRFQTLEGSLAAQDYDGVDKDLPHGGCLVIESEIYHSLSGYDERFRGWGFEDSELLFRLRVKTRVHRLNLELLHLDHPRPSTACPYIQRNARHFKRLREGAAPLWDGPMGDVARYSSANC